MGILGETLVAAIHKKEQQLRCPDCGHKEVIHLVAKTTKKTIVCCQGNRQKCKCQTAPQGTSLLS